MQQENFNLTSSLSVKVQFLSAVELATVHQMTALGHACNNLIPEAYILL
jgi:hypothetical protein